MSVLLTVNIVSHNPARSSSDNIPYSRFRQSPSITRMLSSGGEGVQAIKLVEEVGKRTINITCSFFSTCDIAAS